MKKYYDKTIYNPNSGLLKALCVDWWLTRVTLVVAFGFVAQKFWEMAGTYESLFCLKRNAASVMLTMLGGGDNQNTTTW